MVATNSCTQVSGYRWDFGDGTTSNLANPAHTFARDGVYRVCLTVTADNGREKCSDTFCRNITISGCRGIISFKKGQEGGITTDAELNEFNASVFPNPFGQRLSVRFENPSEQKVAITLLNGNGQQVALLSDESRAAGNHEVQFDVEALHLAEGIYFIAIRSEQHTSYKKVLYRK